LNVGINNYFLDNVEEVNKAFYGSDAPAALEIVTKPEAVKIPEGKGVEEIQKKLAALSS